MLRCTPLRVVLCVHHIALYPPALPPPPLCRGGLVGPWTTLSPLMALCTDPLEEIRSRALRMLRHLCDK